MMEVMKKIAILGFRREGQSLLRFFKHSSRFKNAEVWVLDKNKNLALPRGVHARLGVRHLERLTEFDVIFRSPGIPYLSPQIQAAKKRGVEISSATKLFFEELRKRYPLLATRHSPLLIGITGTKGKGTTATLLYKILKAAGKDAYLAGNIGAPALDLLARKSQIANSKSLIILELSSFQLQDLETSPHIAAVLDVFPDHLDAHKSLAEYYRAKASIARHQTKNDAIFFFAHNVVSRALARQSAGKKIAVDEKRFRLFAPRDVRLPGAHNFKNAVMAAAIARSLGVKPATIRRVVKSFRGNEHRLEHVRTIRYSNVLKNMRISFYNDSASTIPQPTAAALRSFPGKTKILIAGGRSKVRDYSPIRNALNSETGLVILIGENKKEIARAIKRQGTRNKEQGKYKIIFVRTLKEAVQCAYSSARSFLVPCP
ncbi:MAG: UDP-N-acetylmuramoyl-L-alanine--D-glutamate ligase, partial [Candidatus Harrisonbacteria bacterium]|nr:UDP-N-acetylmuramoyl-L-alanine--D-glutamate ligase [Candidatus Harrisonbacteria bacterium]